MVRLITGEQECNNQSLTTPTDRGRDKRPQGAARSVGCFYWDILAIRQCAAPGRNVRETCNALPELAFPHIAGGGDG
jgi:hypothetical protein